MVDIDRSDVRVDGQCLSCHQGYSVPARGVIVSDVDDPNHDHHIEIDFWWTCSECGTQYGHNVDYFGSYDGDVPDVVPFTNGDIHITVVGGTMSNF